MTTTRSLAALVAALCWASVGLAQDAPKDDKDAALERLLEKIDSPDGDKAKAEPKKDDAGPDGKKADSAKDDSKPADAEQAEKKAAEPEDDALDSLLEKIGQQDPEPAPPPRRPGTPAPKADDKDKPEAGKLSGDSEKLDEHLEEILGRKKKPKNQQPQQGQGGKLGEAVEKMDEVTKRLSKTDTGDQTRKKQGEIVKDLESILKQLRQQAGQGKGRMSRRVRQAGNQDGQPQGQQVGNNPGGAPPMPPKRPTDVHAIVGDKSEWGHLPPELRTELENTFKEEPLETRRELIERYFLSIKKDRDRKE